MNEFLTNLPATLLRSGIAVAVSAALVALLFRALQISSPKLRRLAYLGIIVQGCVLAQTSVAVPVLRPDTSAREEFVEQAHAIAQIPFPAEVEGNWDAKSSDDLLFDAQPSVAADFSTTPADNSSILSRVEWIKLIGIVWLAGIVVLVCRAGWNYVRFLQNLSATTDCDPRWELEWNEIQRSVGRRSLVPLQVSACAGPMLCRTLRGYRLFVPAEYWSRLHDDQRMVVLRHELAHLQRHDVWKSLAIRVLALPQWFNPAAWWIVRKFDECAEWACDEFACAASPRQVPGYARALLQLSDRSGSMLMSTSAASGGGLSTRIRRLLSSDPWKDSKMKQFTVIAVVLIVSLLNVVRVELSAQDVAPAAKPAEPASSPTVDRTTTGGAPSSDSSTAVVKKTAAEPAAETKPTVEKGAAPYEAIVDLAVVFRELKQFNRERDQLKAGIEESDRWAKKQSVEIKALKLKVALFVVTDANRSQFQELEKTLAANQSAFDAQRKAYQQQFLRQETEIYQKIYNRVTEEVAAYAKERGIRVVRRRKRETDETKPKSDVLVAKADGAPSTSRDDNIAAADHREGGGAKAEVAKSDATNPNEILKQLQREVLFVDESKPVDITEEIIKRLNAKDAAANTPAAAK